LKKMLLLKLAHSELCKILSVEIPKV
jgi:hypothetical protein